MFSATIFSTHHNLCTTHAETKCQPVPSLPITVWLALETGLQDRSLIGREATLTWWCRTATRGLCWHRKWGRNAVDFRWDDDSQVRPVEGVLVLRWCGYSVTWNSARSWVIAGCGRGPFWGSQGRLWRSVLGVGHRKFANVVLKSWKKQGHFNMNMNHCFFSWPLNMHMSLK